MGKTHAACGCFQRPDSLIVDPINSADDVVSRILPCPPDLTGLFSICSSAVSLNRVTLEDEVQAEALLCTNMAGRLQSVITSSTDVRQQRSLSLYRAHYQPRQQAWWTVIV
jgi:hypothetical protein